MSDQDEQTELFMEYKPATLRSTVEQDEHTRAAAAAFDYTFDGVVEFTPPPFTLPDSGFNIGLIVGPSGSGKSTILSKIGTPQTVTWQSQKAIVSQLGSSVDAQNKLSAVGLNSVPTWFKPHHVLSTGEQFRADLARRLHDGAVVDEFTSVVDRNVAKSCSNAVQRYIRKEQIRDVVFATCHYDVLQWLRPCWVFDTATGSFLARGSLQRPPIQINIEPSGRQAWPMFRDHHYLSGVLNKSSYCWVATWRGALVGFVAALPLPSGQVINAWREHRTVILPDFQGLGIGTRLSDAVAQLFLNRGKKYYSKTTHPRFGGYRNNSPLWRATKHNMRKSAYSHGNITSWQPRTVFSYSHEYIGPPDPHAASVDE